jgi:hypothetical protein
MRGGNFDSIFKSKYKVLKVRDGKNLIRILPPTWDGAKHYGYDLWVNYGIGVDNQSYLSLSKMKGEKDPLAEARRDAEKQGDKDLVKALNPRQRILMWVIDRNDEDEGPQLWAAPFSVDKALASLSFDEDTKEVMYVDDPKEGNDIRFYKEGQGLKTDYPPEKMRILQASPIHSDKGQAQEWLDYIADNPLPECVQFYDYDHIATTFDGNARVEKPEAEDEEKPARRSAPAEDEEPEERPRRAKPVDDDPPFNGSRRRTVIEEPEEEPDEKPVRGRSRIDDEEPEEKPRRARVVDDEESEEKPRGSIRDRLSRRAAVDED